MLYKFDGFTYHREMGGAQSKARCIVDFKNSLIIHELKNLSRALKSSHARVLNHGKTLSN